MIVATLITDCQEKGNESNYILQFLREVRPRNKAILLGFMVASVFRRILKEIV